MGWVCEDGSHEGYLVGYVPDEEHGMFVGHVSGRWREVGARKDHDGQTITLTHVKVACSCGWRSPLLWAPAGCEYVPCCVFAPDHFEDQCMLLWQHHVQASGEAHDGGYFVGTLLERAKGSST